MRLKQEKVKEIHDRIYHSQTILKSKHIYCQTKGKENESNKRKNTLLMGRSRKEQQTIRMTVD